MQQVLDIKLAARTTWATGDYDAMMRQERLYGVGERLVARLGVSPGDTVLDVCCGTGNVAIPAAQAGAEVTGLDLTPSMLRVAQRRAREVGVTVDWVEGDVEELPFDDATFDVVTSAFGCMFAPRHQVAAGELARVLRPGGSLGICSWTPEGAIGDFFRTVGAHLPPLPDVVDPPPLWGMEEHVRQLFRGTGLELGFTRETWEIAHDSADAAVECYTTAFGPVVEARRLAEAQGRWAGLRADMLALFARQGRTRGPRLVFPAEYLVVIGRRTR
jgi:ubiquinone/menaquinone biosynthesis C-methylase UbiE